MTDSVLAPLMDGDVLATAYRAVLQELQTVFPAGGRYRYVPITPRPSEAQWRAFTAKLPVIGVGWQGWHAERGGSVNFRGPCVFSVAILTEHRSPDHLYLGSSNQPGAFGVAAAAISVLNGLTIPGVGSAFVESASSVELAQYLSEGQASVLLTINIHSVALDVARVTAQLDTLKTLSETYQTSTGETL